MPVGLPPTKAPNCLMCRHFLVTWEPDYPRGCEVFGIKTRNMPSSEVFAATGTHCPAFEHIERRPRNDNGASGSGENSPNGGIWA
jgi:hypothetical protein